MTDDRIREIIFARGDCDHGSHPQYCTDCYVVAVRCAVDEAVTECAKVADDAAAVWRQKFIDADWSSHMIQQGQYSQWACEEVAAKIRALRRAAPDPEPSTPPSIGRHQ